MFDVITMCVCDIRLNFKKWGWNWFSIHFDARERIPFFFFALTPNRNSVPFLIWFLNVLSAHIVLFQWTTFRRYKRNIHDLNFSFNCSICQWFLVLRQHPLRISYLFPSVKNTKENLFWTCSVDLPSFFARKMIKERHRSDLNFFFFLQHIENMKAFLCWFANLCSFSISYSCNTRKSFLCRPPKWKKISFLKCHAKARCASMRTYTAD